MTQRDLFGGVTRQKYLKQRVELECEVCALTDAAAWLRFIDEEGREAEAWAPLKHLRFRGNGSPQKGVQVLDIERFKAREIGADVTV